MRKIAAIVVIFALILSFCTAFAPQASAAPAHPSDSVKALYAGKYFSMLLTESGELWTWGDNRYGQLGLGDTQTRTEPVLVMSGVVSAAAGGWAGYAVDAEGTLWAWGNNEQGQLGLGDTTNRLTPTRVMSGVTAVAAALNRAYATDGEGRLVAWGNSSFYYPDGKRLGSLPRTVADGVDAVFCGGNTTLLLRGDRLSGWGGAVAESVDEQRVVTEKEIALGVTAAAADAEGVLYIENGTLCRAVGGEKTVLLENAAAVSVSETHGLALDNGGTLWAWGANTYGEVGVGSNTAVTEPAAVLTCAEVICAGGGFSLAAKAGSCIWAWGDNTYRQIAGGENIWSYNFPHIACHGAHMHSHAAGGDYHVILNGELMQFDVQPIIVENRMLAPMRAIIEKYGSVEWDGETRTVTAVQGGLTVVLKIDSDIALVNGEEVKLDSPAIIRSNRTLVPIRFLCETLGANVSYDESERTADIYTVPQSLELTDGLADEYRSANVKIDVTLFNGANGTASGVVMHTDGLIVTNRHVVEAARTLRITDAHGRTSDMWEVFYADPYLDYAIIKTDLTLPAAAAAGRSGALRLGDKVAVCGNSADTVGDVRSAEITRFGYDDGGSFICSAPSVQGSSGGAVYSSSGLIGIIWGGVSGKTAAIPISAVESKLQLARVYYGLN